MNFNLIHNILNLAIFGLIGALLASGCTQAATGGAIECSQSWINPTWTGIAVMVASGGKMLLNVIRDGIGGLYKQQPPIK